MEKRVFEDYAAEAINKPMPLIIGLTSPSFGGKTYSALRLATGIQRITGGDIGGIDTEAGRMLHYKDKFKFRHVPFVPPFNPLSYAAAIGHCVAKGMKVIIVDSMSHEHTGEGGVLDAIDTYLEDRVARKKPHEDDYDVRERYKWSAQIAIKAERRKLNEQIRQVGANAVLIFCYQASDKTKPIAGGKPVHVGWQAETTSNLPFLMTVRFLLPPASDGHPNLTPNTEFEKMSVKMPEQFRDWFKPGLQLNEDLGERLARWSAGSAAPPQEPKAEKKRDPVAGLNALLSLGQWPDAEARVLAAYHKNHRSELTEADVDRLTIDYKGIKVSLKVGENFFDKRFPRLDKEPGSEG